MNRTINEYGLKKRAFIGDAILAMFTRNTVAAQYDSGFLFVICNNLCSNNYLHKVIGYYNLDKTGITSPTHYEARLYDIYLEHGEDIAYIYWVLTVYAYNCKHPQKVTLQKPII